MNSFVCKADPLGGDEVESVLLHISEAIPENLTLEQAESFYSRQAAQVENALMHLPGGTMHCLLIRLLQRKADLYRGLYAPRLARIPPGA